jgi:hypothetical protein
MELAEVLAEFQRLHPQFAWIGLYWKQPEGLALRASAGTGSEPTWLGLDSGPTPLVLQGEAFLLGASEVEEQSLVCYLEARSELWLSLPQGRGILKAIHPSLEAFGPKELQAAQALVQQLERLGMLE